MQTWYRQLFEIAPGPIAAALFARVALAVGVPLVLGIVTGQTLAGVVAAATAMFVTMCDVGTTRRGRLLTMAAGLAAFLAGGVVGAKWGGTTYADEVVVLGSALLAGWVSNSHPGVSAIARFAAIATAASAGLQITDPIAILAVIGGGASALAAAVITWLVDPPAPDTNFMDWRSGLRRALAGADAGSRFAIFFAAAAGVAFFAAASLGVTYPYWATLTVITVMRREGMVSLSLVLHYMVGTLLGIAVAAAFSHVLQAPLALAAVAAAAAGFARIGQAMNPALGFTAFTVFLMLVVDLALAARGAPPHLMSTRLYDVGVGCVIVLVATVLAAGGIRTGAPPVPAVEGAGMPARPD
jgi:hypothetical protein